MNVHTNPRHAAIALCGMAFVLVTLLLGHPGEPVPVGSIVAIVMIVGVAIVGLLQAYHGDAIRKSWRTAQYDRRVDRHFHR